MPLRFEVCRPVSCWMYGSIVRGTVVYSSLTEQVHVRCCSVISFDSACQNFSVYLLSKAMPGMVREDLEEAMEGKAAWRVA